MANVWSDVVNCVANESGSLVGETLLDSTNPTSVRACMSAVRACLVILAACADIVVSAKL